MKQFGTIKSFNEETGQGSIAPETGGEELRFERSAISWGPEITPKTGQRLSYELAQNDGRSSAVNLQTV